MPATSSGLRKKKALSRWRKPTPAFVPKAAPTPKASSISAVPLTRTS